MPWFLVRHFSGFYCEGVSDEIKILIWTLSKANCSAYVGGPHPIKLRPEKNMMTSIPKARKNSPAHCHKTRLTSGFLALQSSSPPADSGLFSPCSLMKKLFIINIFPMSILLYHFSRDITNKLFNQVLEFLL